MSRLRAFLIVLSHLYVQSGIVLILPTLVPHASAEQKAPSLVVKWPSDVLPTVSALACSPDAAVIAAAHWGDGRISLWDWKEGRLRNELIGHKKAVQSLMFSSDGRLLASGGDGREVMIWDVENGGCIRILPVLETDNGWVNRVCFSPRGDLLASDCRFNTKGYWEWRVFIWDVTNGELTCSLERFASPIFISDHVLLMVGPRKDDKRDQGQHPTMIGLYDMCKDRFVALSQQEMDKISAVAYEAGSETAAASSYGVVQLWNLRERKRLYVVKNKFGDVHSLAFSHDGKHLAVRTEHGKVWLINTTTRKSSLLAAIRHSSSVTFSGNRDPLLVGTMAVELWETDAPTAGVCFQLLPVVTSNRSEWITFTRDGYFEKSDQADRFLAWRDGDRLVEFVTRLDTHHRPDLVRKACQANAPQRRAEQRSDK